MPVSLLLRELVSQACRLNCEVYRQFANALRKVLEIDMRGRALICLAVSNDDMRGGVASITRNKFCRGACTLAAFAVR
jgi:hypothetical protein